MAIRIEKERGVNAPLVYPNRLRPFSGRIICIDIEIAACRYIRRSYIEDPVMVANSGGINTSRAHAFLERYLARSCETISNLSPVNQVATVKDGHAWKIFASGGDKIIILTDPTDTRVGVKAGNYWIAVHTDLLSFLIPKFGPN